MKAFCTGFLLLLLNHLFSQCPTSNVEFHDQSELDAFAAEYPNCTDLPGNLRLWPSFTNQDFTNLNGLSNIQTIYGKLELWSIDGLTSLSGLENLQSIGHGLEISFCESLSDISALGNLTHVGPVQTGYDMGSCISISETGISNLHGLEGLTKLDGHLSVSFNPSLTTLDGIQNIQTIDGSLSIRANPMISDISALSQIDTIKSVIELSNMSADIHQIVNIRGFTGLFLTEITSMTTLPFFEENISLKWLGIISNPQLQNLNGIQSFRNMEDIAIHENPLITNLNGLTDWTDSCNISFGSNSSLTDISVFEGITTCGDLYIGDNDLLSDISPFQDLHHIFGSLQIYNAESLNSLDVFSQLDSIDGSLSIEFTYLTDLSGLENVEYIGNGIGISQNKDLTSISALDDFKMNNGSVYIYENSVLEDFFGTCENDTVPNLVIFSNNDLVEINSLTSVQHIGALHLTDNAVLSTISPFQNLTSIVDLDIQNSPNLTNLDFLNQAEVQNSILIINNATLAHINGIKPAEYMTYQIDIQTNPLLTNLNSLNTLHHVEWDIRIFQCHSLNSLSGLDNLETVNGMLEINKNNSLTDITALENLQTFNLIRILNNSQLSNCSIEPICEIFGSNPNNAWLYATNNMEGCKTNDQVEETCFPVGTSLPEAATGIQISPNPSDGRLTITCTDPDTKWTIAELYDFQGRIINTINLNEQRILQLDLSGFTVGQYVLKLMSKEGDFSTEIIIIQ